MLSFKSHLSIRTGGPEKTMDLVDRDVVINAIASQRTQFGTAQKRARNQYEIENTETIIKKVCRDQQYARDDVTDIEIKICRQDSAENSSSRIAQDTRSYPLSTVNTDARDRMVVGKDEVSSTEFQNHPDTQSKPSLIDQPLLRSPTTARKQNHNLPSSRTDTPTDSSRIDHSLLSPSGNLMDSLDTQGMADKAHEEPRVLDNPGDGHSECQKDALILRENVLANTVEPSSLRLTTVAHQDHLTSAYHPPQTLRRSNISSAASSAISIADLLNGNPHSAKHTHLLQSAIPTTKFSAPPSTDTSLTKRQNDPSAGLQSHTKASISSRGRYSNTLPSISAPPEGPAPYDQASRPSGPASPRGSVIDSASGVSDDKLRLEGKAVSEKLGVIGRILMPHRNAPGSRVMLPVYALLSEDVLGFFRLYSQVAGVGEVSVLSFDLIDVTWKRDRLRKISRGDSDTFCALKQTIWGCLCILLRGDPGLAMFRVKVTSTQHMVNNTVAISKPLGNESETGGAPGPLTKLAHQNPAATSNTEPVHFPTATSQAPVPIIQLSHSEMVPRREHQPTPRSRDASLARQHTHPTIRLQAPSTSGCSLSPITPGKQSASQLASAPQCRYRLAGPTRLACKPDNPVDQLKIIVRIQLNGHGEFSSRYNRNVLLSKITNVDFFAWFAIRAGYTRHSVPAELEFTFKDSLPQPRRSKVTMGNEGHFEYMKLDAKRQFERATALMTELIEFAILVTVPGRTMEQQGGQSD